MHDEQVIVPVTVEELLPKVEELVKKGFRMVQIHSVRLEKMQINYSFELDYQFLNLRLEIEPGTEIPSISGLFPSAFLYENEMHDLFGISVLDMSIDFKGNLYQTAVKTPFNQQEKES